MLAVRLPKNLETRLDILVASTKRPKSFYMREALEIFLDENEEIYQAVAAYEDQKRRGTLELVSMEDLMKDLGIDTKDLDAEAL